MAVYCHTVLLVPDSRLMQKAVELHQLTGMVDLQVTLGFGAIRARKLGGSGVAGGARGAAAARGGGAAPGPATGIRGVVDAEDPAGGSGTGHHRWSRRALLSVQLVLNEESAPPWLCRRWMPWRDETRRHYSRIGQLNGASGGRPS